MAILGIVVSDRRMDFLRCVAFTPFGQLEL